jgi:LPXTG-motif cell wall-anchored protein
VPTLRRVVVVLAALAVGMPGAAVAQTSTVADDGSGVSSKPPVALDGGGGPPAPPAATPATPAAAPSAQAAGGLPNTGSDPRMMLLVGLTLMLLGVGLRLRTADAELY